MIINALFDKTATKLPTEAIELIHGIFEKTNEDELTLDEFKAIVWMQYLIYLKLHMPPRYASYFGPQSRPTNEITHRPLGKEMEECIQKDFAKNRKDREMEELFRKAEGNRKDK